MIYVYGRLYGIKTIQNKSNKKHASLRPELWRCMSTCTVCWCGFQTHFLQLLRVSSVFLPTAFRGMESLLSWTLLTCSRSLLGWPHTLCTCRSHTHTHTHVSHSGRSSVCRSDSGVDVGVVSRSATRRCCFFNSWDSQSRCLWKVNFEPGSLMMIWGWTVQVRRIESISFYRTLDFEKDKRDSVSL